MGGVKPNNVLGVPFVAEDGRMLIRAIAHAALTGGKIYGVVPSRDTTTDVTTGAAANDGKAVTIVPATNAVHSWHGAALRDYALGDVATLVCGGPMKAYAINTAGAITGGTSFLKLVNASSNLQVDGAAQTVNSVALACEDQNSATASLINVQFLALPDII